jgi:hypothetical protein
MSVTASQPWRQQRAAANPAPVFHPKHHLQHLVLKLVTGNAGQGADSNKEYEASDKSGLWESWECLPQVAKQQVDQYGDP